MIKQNDPRISAYLLGELDPAEVEVFEQALRSSPMLAKNVEQVRQTIELLKLAFPEKKEQISGPVRRQSSPCPDAGRNSALKILRKNFLKKTFSDLQSVWNALYCSQVLTNGGAVWT